MRPKLIKGKLFVDNRGKVAFNNNFNFKKIKRFYVVQNHAKNFVRAWHGHKKEAKYIMCLIGHAQLCAIKIDNFNKPSKKLKIEKWFLSDSSTDIVYIPPGYANGFMSLTDNTKLIIFSTSTLKQSLKDDYRYPSRYWDVWKVEEK